MTEKNQKNITLGETLEDNQSSNTNFALVSRDETSLVNCETNKPTSLILPTRRQFLTTASIATAGLLIQPIEGFANLLAGRRYGILDLFKNFGKALFFNALNFLPSSLTPFINLAASALGQVRGNGFPQWDWRTGCFGNFGKDDSTNVFGCIGGQQGLNAGAALLDKNLPNVIKAILASASYIGIQDVAPQFFGDAANLQAIKNIPLPPAQLLPAKPSDREKFIALWQDKIKKQIYFAPDMSSEISTMAAGTINAPRTLARDFTTPQLFQSKTGSIIMVLYEIGRDTEYKPGENGAGESVVYVTNPINENTRKKILKNRDFLTNKTQREELLKIVQGENAADEIEGRKFNFLVGDK